MTNTTEPHEIYSKAERGAARKDRLAQADTLHYKVVSQGLEAAAFWGAGATGLSYALHKQIIPNNIYASISPPYRVFLVAVITTGAFFTRTDIASITYDRAFSSKYSITDTLDVQTPVANSWMAQNKTKLMFGIWASCFSAALYYNFRRGDISKPQKIINSRLVAQTSVLAGMGIAAIGGALFPDDVD